MTTPSSDALLQRRYQTLGEYSPLFYDEPLHFTSAQGTWLTTAEGDRYLDGYNNVPQVGHCNPRIVEAVAAQMGTYNVHSRYLNDVSVEYAEELLATFDESLDRVYFTNSGSEANDLALRIARKFTGNRGVIVTDFSYHGNTTALAELTTGLAVSEARPDYIGTITIPDLDFADGAAESDLRQQALEQVDAVIEELEAAGHGLAAILFDPVFSTEGLPRLPEGYIDGLLQRVRAAGGVVIADEVQAGLGRLGAYWWGHQSMGIVPDLATLGKPLGNGFPLGGVVTRAELMDSFSSENMYFNTFGGSPAASAAGRAVLAEVRERDLLAHSAKLGEVIKRRLQEIANRHPEIAVAKGTGLFFGLALLDAEKNPDPHLAKAVVEGMVRQNILISKIGPADNILKIRPPLVITEEEVDLLLTTLERVLDAALAQD
ncbi:aspartate aminotransferase family protein [Micrococcoides hystricis]|uniref:Aspartate aminotransferase family protein n=1 Tax=Micrococcoides hystricis TaxID=1572761 RepID=A0ABV6PBF7_9MICC